MNKENKTLDNPQNNHGGNMSDLHDIGKTEEGVWDESLYGPPERPKCLLCMFFMAEEPSTYRGDCHRYPPTYVNDTVGVLFPAVHAFLLCGEYRRRSETQEEK
jgi:hypothetical protein